MKIELAGYNVDANALEMLRTRGDKTDTALTPETLVAAYARISRSPDNITCLRENAGRDLKASRELNERVIRGLHHESVAEHAVFNFDITGISRLVAEIIESTRLASYTEKSQRYTNVGKNYVVPREVIEMGLQEEFKNVVDLSLELYDKVLERFQGKYNAVKPEEDARYVTTLSMETQLGMTVNARSLTRMVRRLRSYPLHETEAVALQLTKLANEVAPSLVNYSDADSDVFYAPLNRRFKEETPVVYSESPVTLLTSADDLESALIAGISYAVSGNPYEYCLVQAKRMGSFARDDMYRKIFDGQSENNQLPRVFENVVLQFDVLVSAVCFGQLKRHRMLTLIPQDYLLVHGWYIPPTMASMLDEDLNRGSELRIRQLYRQIYEKYPSAAPYVLTQGHKRRALISMNLRELFHFLSLRTAPDAQWEIRNLAHKMFDVVMDKMPIIMGYFKFTKREVTPQFVKADQSSVSESGSAQ